LLGIVDHGCGSACCSGSRAGFKIVHGGHAIDLRIEMSVNVHAAGQNPFFRRINDFARNLGYFLANFRNDPVFDQNIRLVDIRGRLDRAVLDQSRHRFSSCRNGGFPITPILSWQRSAVILRMPPKRYEAFRTLVIEGHAACAAPAWNSFIGGNSRPSYLS
jgi:hypothetical protein